jgi:hypothetical protein
LRKIFSKKLFQKMVSKNGFSKWLESLPVWKRTWKESRYVTRNQGDQMSLWKSRPKCSTIPVLTKLIQQLSVKSGLKVWSTPVIF